MTRSSSALSERGSTRQWRSIRALALHRDRHRCRACGRRATTVDHIRPRAVGGTDDLGNLQALCAPCHKLKSAGALRHHEGAGALAPMPVGPALDTGREW